MLSYGYKNTVGAVAHLFFSDPPFAPHATTGSRPTETFQLYSELQLQCINQIGSQLLIYFAFCTKEEVLNNFQLDFGYCVLKKIYVEY